ncbi:endospore germination permease [Paenibacillus cellulosilyticus]|nr:endospore germination permease [Paenibacillus cellulosilyticus]
MATGFLVLPALGSLYAPYDFWMSSILTMIPGAITIVLATSLHARFPGLTIIESGQRIVGKVFGKLVGLLYFFYFLHFTGVISREYAEFVKSSFLFDTPMLFVSCSLLVLAACAVRGGVNVLSKSAVIFAILSSLPLLFLLLLIPDLNWTYMLPMLSQGVVPVLKAAAVPQGWVSELFLMTFFLPYVKDQKKAKQSSYAALGVIGISMMLINLVVLMLLGPDTSNKMYPVLVAFRYMSVGGFFENLEALLLAMWVLGNLVKQSVCLYATVITFSQCFGVSDFRSFAFPIAILAAVFGLWDLPNIAALHTLIQKVSVFETPLFTIVIPLLLLLIAWMTGRRGTNQGGVNG